MLRDQLLLIQVKGAGRYSEEPTKILGCERGPLKLLSPKRGPWNSTKLILAI